MKGAKLILEILNKSGFPAYIVGGAVRDILLGRSPKDIDIVTKAKPDEIIEIVTKAGLVCTDLVGKSFGVIVVSTGESSYEVATYRSERYGTDSHRPEEVSFADTLEEDVLRRDFTINGMAMDKEGELWDYVGGEEDIKKKILRTIGPSEERFKEDALRAFRACRFVGQLDFMANPSLIEGIEASLFRVKGLSLERVKIELEKLLVSPAVGKGLDILVQSKLGNQSCRVVEHGEMREVPILPELYHLVDLPQDRRYHAFDGWYHTLAVTQNTPPELIIRWGALLHDVAKGLPHIRAFQKGKLTDYGHDEEGATMARQILERLGYSDKLSNRVAWIVQNHMKFHYYATHQEADPWKWIRKEARSGRYRKTEELIEACRQLMEVCVGDVIGCGRPFSATDGTRAFGECMQAIAERMPIHTRDLAYPQEVVALAGPLTGKLLQNLLSQVQNGCLENRSDVLLEASKKWLQRRAQYMIKNDV